MIFTAGLDGLIITAQFFLACKLKLSHTDNITQTNFVHSNYFSLAAEKVFSSTTSSRKFEIEQKCKS